jgi:hypothetical protein
VLDKIPNTQKFLVADRYETKVLDLLEQYVRAYYSAKEQKPALLKEANIALKQLRFLTRLLPDMKFINHVCDPKRQQLSRVRQVGRSERRHLLRSINIGSACGA